MALGAAVVFAALAVLALLSSLTPQTALGHPNWLRWAQMAAVGAPGLAFWAIGGWAAWRRRWATLGWLLGGSIVAALLAGAPSLWSDLQQRAPGETYSWEGAGFIWFVGVTVAGLAGLLIFGARQAWGWIGQHRARRKQAAMPA